MIPFDFQLRTRIVYGPGSIARLGELTSELGARRVLVVSDPGVVAAGHAQRGIDALQRAGIEAHLFSDVQQNPTTDDVENGVRIASRFEAEAIVGLGGGSSMDCAKGINFIFTNGGKMQDYWGVGKALRPMLPMVAVPTTSGTGSETQSFALISDSKTHAKMACGDKKASFRIAVLDPELTQTQPPIVTALTGIDALAHAAETYVTKHKNWISLHFSREAWRLLVSSLGKVITALDDLDSRGGMQLGACFAGLAIENSMLGATHALANPLTADFNVVHGQAIATMLPHVVRFNGETNPDPYADLLALVPTANVPGETLPKGHAAVESLATHIAGLVRMAGLDRTLEELGVTRESLPQLADEASKQWTATFNPRPVTSADLMLLYERAFSRANGH